MKKKGKTDFFLQKYTVISYFLTKNQNIFKNTFFRGTISFFLCFCHIVDNFE